MDTTANLANSRVAKTTDVHAFMVWAEKSRELSDEEKKRLARLIESFQKESSK